MNLEVESFISLFFIGAGIIGALIVGLLLLFRSEGKQISNYFLGALLLCAALTSLNNFLATSGVYSQFPNLYFLPLSFGFSFAPLFYYFVKSKTIQHYQFGFKDFLHFVLPLLQFAFFLAIGFRSLEFKSWVWRELYGPYLQYIDEGGFVLISLFYLMASRRLIKAQSMNKKWQNELHQWMSRFTSVFGIFIWINAVYTIGDWVSLAYGVNIYNIPYLTIPMDISTILLIYWMIVNAWMYSHQSLIFEEKKKEEGDLDSLLFKLFDTDAIYMNPDLDLNLLSKVIGEPRNKLSKHFSQRSTTFTEFVHEYRVNAFIQLVEDGKLKHFGIEGLSMDVGFNSRATFYRAFKNKMGISPSEYIKNVNE